MKYLHIVARFVLLTAFTYAASSVAASTVASTSVPTSAATPTHTIQVGNPAHSFGPEWIKADVGDIIEFEFYPPEHSVVRASKGNPCMPYENFNPGKQGFFSGMRKVQSGEKSPTWKLRINNTEEIFFYCSAPGSCKDSRMIGVINPNGTDSLPKQKASINKDTILLQPGDPILPEGTPVPSSQPIPPKDTPSTEPHTHTHTSLSTGAIIGISFGGAAVVVLALSLCYFAKMLQAFMKRRNASHGDSAHHNMAQTSAFEGCVPVKSDHMKPLSPADFPPLYTTADSNMHLHPAHWMSAYDGLPQELDGGTVRPTS